MYTSFHVENFRGFEDLELTDLARINLIAGKNNVGKTALLEAIYLHGRGYNPQEVMNLNQARGLEYAVASNINLIFNKLDTVQNITIEATDLETGFRSLVLRVVREPDELSQLNIQITTNGNSDGQSSLNEEMQVLALDYERIHDGRRGTAYLTRSSSGSISLSGALLPAIRIAFSLAQGRATSEELVQRYSSLEVANQHEFLLNALRTLEPQLKRVSILVVSGRPALWADVGNNKVLPLNVLGDGLNSLFHLITTINEYRGGVVLVDEIENGLHYSVLADVWASVAKAARAFNVQIFATTHSLEMIRAAHEAFNNDDPYDFRLHRLDRSPKTGEIYATTYDREGMDAVINLNAEVRG